MVYRFIIGSDYSRRSLFLAVAVFAGMAVAISEKGFLYINVLGRVFSLAHIEGADACGSGGGVGYIRHFDYWFLCDLRYSHGQGLVYRHRDRLGAAELYFNFSFR